MKNRLHIYQELREPLKKSQFSSADHWFHWIYFLGKGFVQTFLYNPDRALETEIASGCMTFGMFSGSFTGKKITEYINSETKDYYNARRVINGLDCAEQIKSYAEIIEEILEESM